MLPLLFIPPSWPWSRSAWGAKSSSNLGEAAGREEVVAADARALLKMDGVGEAVGGQHVVGHLKRLLEADRTAQSASAELQEDLIGGIVVRVKEQLGEDLRQGARLSVNVDRLQSLGHGSDRDLAMDAVAGALDEGCDQLAGVLEADRWDPGQD